MNSHSSFRWILLVATAFAMVGCAIGPDYVRPVVAPPVAYKEAGLWLPAQPHDAGANQPWWTCYGDPELNALVKQADIANQDISIAEAHYRQARAAAQFARSSYAPTVGASVSVDRSRAQSNVGYTTANSHVLLLDASWEPDIWGRVRRSVEAGEAVTQASAADLAAIRLTIQSELVQSYLQLRITDAQKDLLAHNVKAYSKALELTRSQYLAGIVMRADVALAETQLQSTRAQAIDLGVQRAQLEHAIAFLIGRSPAELTITPRPAVALGITLPVVPVDLPSQLLERRPDIAAAERRAAAANAEIGVAQSAYYPSLQLNASGGYSSANVAQWINTPARIWSLGASLAATIFDGGARRAQSDAAVAAYDTAAAQYKRTVLAGFQEVEDSLAALHIIGEERTVQDAAVAAAGEAERTSLAQYRAGTVTYLAVVTSQTLSLTNQRTALDLLGRQLVMSAALVKALGGGWNVSELSGLGALGNAVPSGVVSPTLPAVGAANNF